MSFTIKELITDILRSELDQGEKIEILNRLYTTGRVSDEFYLRRNDGSDELECWYKNVDKNGIADPVPTNYTAQETLQAYIHRSKPDYKPITK